MIATRSVGALMKAPFDLRPLAGLPPAAAATIQRSADLLRTLAPLRPPRPRGTKIGAGGIAEAGASFAGTISE